MFYSLKETYIIFEMQKDFVHMQNIPKNYEEPFLEKHYSFIECSFMHDMSFIQTDE